MPQPCVFGLPDRVEHGELRTLRFSIECESCTSSACRCRGRDCGKIVMVRGLSWFEGRVVIRERRGILVSGFAPRVSTRVWLLSDGSLLFSHDAVEHGGAHLVVFERSVASRLAQLWKRLAEASDVQASPTLRLIDWVARVAAGAARMAVDYGLYVSALSEPTSVLVTRIVETPDGSPVAVTVHKQYSTVMAAAETLAMTLGIARIVVVAAAGSVVLEAMLTPELLAALPDIVAALEEGDTLQAYTMAAWATNRVVVLDADHWVALAWDGRKASAVSVDEEKGLAVSTPEQLAKRLTPGASPGDDDNGNTDIV